MADRSFSMARWFRTGHTPKTSVNVDGYRSSLEGLPPEYTDTGLAQLAASQGANVRFRSPAVTTDSGVKTASSNQFPPADVSAMFLERAGLEKPAKKSRVVNGKPVAEPIPESNGKLETAKVR